MLAEKTRKSYGQSSKFLLEAAEDLFRDEFDRPAVKRVPRFDPSQIAGADQLKYGVEFCGQCFLDRLAVQELKVRLSLRVQFAKAFCAQLFCNGAHGALFHYR